MADKRKRSGVARRMLTAAIAAGLQGDDDAAVRDLRLWADIDLNQALGEALVIAVRPSALRCDVVVTGALVIPRRVREPREVHLPPVAADLAPMRKAPLLVPIPPAGRAAARRALRRGRVVTARLELRATDARGHAVSVERVVVLSLAG